MIVVDSNVILYYHVEGDLTREAESVYHRDFEWVAPTLWRSEFRNALVLYVRRGVITLDTALDTMRVAEDTMRGADYEVPSASVLSMAARSGCSAYDCEYVALAEQLGVPLVTEDGEILSKFTRRAVSMRSFL